MNDRQRKTLIIVAVLIGGMILYPPFQIKGHGLGYSWIFSPPYDDATINVSQLLVQWIAVAIIGGIAFILSKKSQAIQTSMQENTTSVLSAETTSSQPSAENPFLLLSYKYTIRVVIVLLVSWIVGCILTKTDPTKMYLIFSYPSGIFDIVMRGLGGLSVPFVMVGSVLYIYGKKQKKPHSFYSYLVWTTVFALIILLK